MAVPSARTPFPREVSTAAPHCPNPLHTSGPPPARLSGDHREGPPRLAGTPSWGIPLEASWKLERPLPQQQAALGLRSQALEGAGEGRGRCRDLCALSGLVATVAPSRSP